MSYQKPNIIFLPYKLHFRYFLSALAVNNNLTVLLPPEKSLPTRSKIKGIRIYYKQFGIDLIKKFISHELRTQKYVTGLKNILNKEKPDVLISCEFYHWYTLQALHFKKKKPELKLFVVSETKRWPENFVARQIKKLVFWYFRINSRYVDAMLVYTEQAQQFLAVYLPQMKTILVPAPIDTNLFKPTQKNTFYRNKTLKILFNARYSKYKRHDDLFSAVSQLSQRGFGIKVTCISRDDKRLFDIKCLVDKNNVKELVHFKKSMSLEDMPALYAENDILILPSYNEAIGMVVPEAMACGKPTITSDTVGANVYVKDGVTGFIFKTGDIDSLASVLEKCCNKDLLKRMGAAARSHILNNYNANQTVQPLEDFIKFGETKNS